MTEKEFNQAAVKVIGELILKEPWVTLYQKEISDFVKKLREELFKDG